MYRQQISRQTSAVLTQTSDRRANHRANHQRSPLVVQRAIATKNPAETDTVNKPLPIPEFKGISAQLLAETQPAPIQAKLTIGQPNDKYEQEADRVADRVVQQIYAPAAIQTEQNIPAIQRSPIAQEFSPEAIAGGEASSNLSSAINSARGGGQALDSKLQESMGQAMGADFSGVRVHTDSQSDRLNKSIQAKAFTTGRDVFFRQGTYQPGNREGQRLIAHELTHVVQQNSNGMNSREVAQRACGDNNATKFTAYGVPEYGALKDDSGTCMDVLLSKTKPVKGSSKTIPPSWWPGGLVGKMVQGHLWNATVGGPGNDRHNLVPITASANTQHDKKVEADVKNAYAKGEVIHYVVTADYTKPAKVTELTTDTAAQAKLLPYVAKIPYKIHAEYTKWDSSITHQTGFGSWDIGNQHKGIT